MKRNILGVYLCDFADDMRIGDDNKFAAIIAMVRKPH